MMGGCVVWTVVVAVVVPLIVHAVCEGLALLAFAYALFLWKIVEDGVAQKGISGVVPSVRTEIRVDPESHLYKFVETDSCMDSNVEDKVC